MTKHMLLCLRHQSKVVSSPGNCQALACLCQCVCTCVCVWVTGCDYDEFPHNQYTYSEKVRHSIIPFFPVFLRSVPELALMCDACVRKRVLCFPVSFWLCLCMYAAFKMTHLKLSGTTAREESIIHTCDHQKWKKNKTKYVVQDFL